VDKFLQNILPMLTPIENISYLPNETYFLHKDDLFIFCEGHAHPPDGMYAKIIYYPHPTGTYDFFGRRYESTFKGYNEKGEYVLYSHLKQLELQYKICPSLDPAETRPVFAEHRVRFQLKDMKGYFEHRKSLKILCERYPEIKKSIKNLMNFFGLPYERFGTTGSLSFGYYKPEEDLDLVIYGTVEECNEMIKIIKEFKKKNPEAEVFEFGKVWPMRFYLDNVLICPFFCLLDRKETPLRDFEMEVIEENLEIKVRVIDDKFTMFMPMLLRVFTIEENGEQIEKEENLIIYDSSLRGEFYKDDLLQLKARKVKVCSPDGIIYAYLVTLSEDIKRLS